MNDKQNAQKYLSYICFLIGSFEVKIIKFETLGIRFLKFHTSECFKNTAMVCNEIIVYIYLYNIFVVQWNTF
jgi:hypothetical protein